MDLHLKIIDQIKNIPKQRKKNMMGELTILGKGIWSKTYTGELKCFPGHTVVVKKIKTGTYANNEFEALMFLRDKMINNELPLYYNFLYGVYSNDSYKHFILEKADMMLDTVMELTNHPVEWYKQVYQQLATAIECLENLKVNHGDLWNDNIMVKNDDSALKFRLILIDWDSAFGENTQFCKPTVGGGNFNRKHFMLGYDLNRYFDAVLYSYNSYLEKKDVCIRKLVRKGIENPEKHEKALEYDKENIVYPERIIQFLKELELVAVPIEDVESDTDLTIMSAKNIIERINNIF